MRNEMVRLALPTWLLWIAFAPIGVAESTGAPANPKLVKLPFAFSTFDHPRMENTPVVFNGRPLLVQNHRPAEADRQESGSYLFIEDLATGQESRV